MKHFIFQVMLFDLTTSPCVITILNLGTLQTHSKIPTNLKPMCSLPNLYITLISFL